MDSSENIVEVLQFKNSFTQQYVTISGEKLWDIPDGDTYPEITIPEITIILKQDGTEVNRITLDEVYTFTFSTDASGNPLPKYRANYTEYEYTVDEADVDGYTKTISGYTITNTYIDRYFYRIDRNYKYYLKGELQSEATVTGEVIEGTANQVITVDPDDYLEYGSRTYAFVGSSNSVTLNVKNGIAVLTLNYELREYQYKVNATYKTITNGVEETDGSVTGDVITTTDTTAAVDTDDYKMYGGNEYAYASGATSIELVEGIVNEINLVYERSITIEPTVYQYRVNVTYKTIVNGVEETDGSVTGGIVTTTDTTAAVNTDDYKMYGGNEYAYASGATSIELVEGIVNEINLVYEREVIDEPEPPLTKNYRYRVNVTYKTIRNGLKSDSTVTGDVVETTNPALELNKDDYKTYGGNEYAYVSGDTSVTLEEEITNEINLVYERR